jgi:hypothetical protein
MFTWTGLRSITYVDGAQYDTFVCAEDDVIDRLDLILASTGNYSIPVTFWYPDNTSMTLILEAEYTRWIPFPCWELNEFQYTLKDSSGYVLYEDSNINLFNNQFRLLIEDGTLYLGDINSGTDLFDKALMHSINISVLPVQAITLDVSDIPSSSYDPAYCMIRVIDDETKTLKFDGWLYWVYTKIDFIGFLTWCCTMSCTLSRSYGMCNLCSGTFRVSFWSYFALIQCIRSLLCGASFQLWLFRHARRLHERHVLGLVSDNSGVQIPHCLIMSLLFCHFTHLRS